MALRNPYPKFLPQVDAFQGSWLCREPPAKHAPLLCTLNHRAPSILCVPHTVQVARRLPRFPARRRDCWGERRVPLAPASTQTTWVVHPVSPTSSHGTSCLCKVMLEQYLVHSKRPVNGNRYWYHGRFRWSTIVGIHLKHTHTNNRHVILKSHICFSEKRG